MGRYVMEGHPLNRAVSLGRLMLVYSFRTWALAWGTQGVLRPRGGGGAVRVAVLHVGPFMIMWVRGLA